jgi:hypothetical protein
MTSVVMAVVVTLATAGQAAALPPPGDPPGTLEDGAAQTTPKPRPTPTPPAPAPAPGGGGVHDAPPDPWGGEGGTNAPPAPNPDAPTPTLRRVAAEVKLQNRSVSALLSVPPGIAIDGGRPFEISVSFGGTRVTQNYDPVHGNRLTHDFSPGDGSRRVEQVDITLRETLANGAYQPYAIRSRLPVEPLYDIKASGLYFHEIGHCDVGSPADPHVWWIDPTGARHNEEIDPGFFDSFDVLDSFSGIWREVGASSALTDPGLKWIDEDALNFANLRPERGVPLLPGTTHKVQRIIPAESGGLCEGEFTYFLDYTLRTYRL